VALGLSQRALPRMGWQAVAGVPARWCTTSSRSPQAPHALLRASPRLAHLQVRRELASLLRDVTGLVGLEPMLQQMAGLVQEAVAQHRQRVAAPGSPSSSAAVWVGLENLMYTANVVMGGCGGRRRWRCRLQALGSGRSGAAAAGLVKRLQGCPGCVPAAAVLQGAPSGWRCCCAAAGANKDELGSPSVLELVHAAAYSVGQFSGGRAVARWRAQVARWWAHGARLSGCAPTGP
jgi:hypothetical protein